MEIFRVGDVVARKSYGCDVLFKIINIYNNGMVDLQGLTVRIVADAPEYDLKHIDGDEINKRIITEEKSRHEKIDRCYRNMTRYNKNTNYYNYKRNNMYYDNPNIYKKEEVFKKPGIVLHLDGDSEYMEKCKKSYKRMGITAYTYNVPEVEQYRQVYSLLQRIRPNILILTGHDAFLKRRNDIYNIDNYKNSKYYIQGVLEARRYEHNLDNLVIFAGACQSYYEAIIQAGANFASAPKRVLIDMMDPLIVAETIAYTPVDEYVPINTIISNTREGISGIGGIQTRGALRTGMPGL